MPDNHRKMALVARTPSVPDLNRIQVERRQAPAASSRTSATPRASPTGDSENDDEDGEDGQDDDDGEDTLTNNSSSSSSTTTTTTPPASSSSSSSISTTTTPPASSSSAASLAAELASSSSSSSPVRNSETGTEDLDPSPYFSGKDTSTMMTSEAVETVFSGGQAVSTIYSTRLVTAAVAEQSDPPAAMGGISSGARSGAIAGGVVGGIAVALIGVLIFLRTRKSRRSSLAANEIRWPDIDRSVALYPEQTKPTGRAGLGDEDDDDDDDVTGDMRERGATSPIVGGGSGAASSSNRLSSAGHDSRYSDDPFSSRNASPGMNFQQGNYSSAGLYSSAPPGSSSAEGAQYLDRTPSPSIENHGGVERPDSPVAMQVGQTPGEWKLRVVNNDD